jgi:diadenosine tetraphosphate (Ap4A) HIT family hydrolase
MGCMDCIFCKIAKYESPASVVFENKYMDYKTELKVRNISDNMKITSFLYQP